MPGALLIGLLETNAAAELDHVGSKRLVIAGYVFHQVGEPVSERVELPVQRDLVPSLRVLEERHQAGT